MSYRLVTTRGEVAIMAETNDGFAGDRFAGRPRGGNDSGWPGSQGWPLSGLWDAVNSLRDGFEQRVAPRMGRGDVRAAILSLLAEGPMHGYQIIQQIEERSGGAWKPSPGSVYPTLQMLADEGLISATESGGKKTYALTESGRAEADASGDKSAPWENQTMRDAAGAMALPKSGAKLAQAAAQVSRSGTPEQIKQAVEVLDEARRRLYSILAQD
jgi:DNA-binding PadR family transcriptional regulator